MSLTHSQLQALKPRNKPYPVTDRDGLYIDVLPTGSMTWRYQYYLHGKREKVTLGPYPAIGLADARKLRDEAAAMVAKGVSPKREKQAKKAELKLEAKRSGSFQTLAERWLEDDVKHKSANWLYSVNNWLKLDIYPAIGRLHPRDIARAHIDQIVGAVVKRGSPSSANKVLMICKQIFEYAVDRCELEHNPATRIKPVKTPPTRSHRPLTVKEVRPFLQALDAVDTRRINKLAIRLMLLTFIRKDELRCAKWEEFDLENGIWEVPAHRMKMRHAHRVYLSRQAHKILLELKELGHGSVYVLPNQSSLSKPIGHTTLNEIINRLDLEGARFVPHGFRSTASSMLNEMHARAEVVELQLSHRDTSSSRGIYNQAEYAEERRDMLQQWADFLDDLERGSNVVPINARRAA